MLQGPSTPMVRPHPAVWRLVHGISVLYLVALIYMLFQDAHDGRLLLKHLYPSLGVELPERAYGSDCRLHIKGQGWNWSVIKATVFDEFVVAHTLGWWAKALILRNYPMLWAISIIFEFMELTFQHMLPNFNECWWDSWILDVAVCNFLGMVMGMWTVKWYGSQKYDWRGISQQPTFGAKARRTFMQLLPYKVERFDWAVFSSPMRCLQSLIPVVFFLIVEVNAFFLKFVLWVPPLNPMNTLRLLLWLGLALPATKEYYQYIEHDTGSFIKIGAFAWLGAALALVETLLAVKYGHGMFPTPWPRRTVVAWTASLSTFTALMAIWCVKFYVLDRRQKLPKKQL
jgi:phosphatidylserine synthase 2